MDSNRDGFLDISDAIYQLAGLIMGGPGPTLDCIRENCPVNKSCP
jgi:hypothetical protein